MIAKYKPFHQLYLAGVGAVCLAASQWLIKIVYISRQSLKGQAKYVFSCLNRAGLSLMEFWIEMDILARQDLCKVNYKEEKSHFLRRKWKHCDCSDRREKTLTECVKISLLFVSPWSSTVLLFSSSQVGCSATSLLGFVPPLSSLLSSQIKSKSFWHWVEYWNNSSQAVISSPI